MCQQPAHRDRALAVLGELGPIVGGGSVEVDEAPIDQHEGQHGNRAHAFSMASLKRRAFNQHLIERICAHLADGQSLEKSSPDYEALCNYGVIAEDAA